MAIALKDVLAIQAGTLIKGLKINLSGAVGFSLDGWLFEQKRIVKNLWSPQDRNRFVFTYYTNTKVQEHIKNSKIIPLQNKSVSYGVLRKNGNSFFKDMHAWFEQGLIDEGDCLGMSLGESFLAIQPSHHDMYRPDFFEVYLFHKILYGEEIRWVALHSKQVNKQLILVESNPLLLDVMMELL